MSDFKIETTPVPPESGWTGKVIQAPVQEDQWSGRKVEPISASYPPPFTTYFVGGPLNGKRRPSVGNSRIAQVQHDGVTLMYERGDRPENDAVYFCGLIDEEGVEVTERILTNS